MTVNRLARQFARRAGTLAVGLLTAALSAPPLAVAAGDVARGEYVFQAAGCANCHTDPGKKNGKNARPKGEPLAGGLPLETPFGTFYTPNITPHPEAGIGKWDLSDFRRALHEGRAPNSAPYYPAFPYTSYTGMTDTDVADMWAYLRTQPESDQRNREHDLKFPFNMRILMHGWRLLFFEQGHVGGTDEAKPAEWKRGAYIVRALAHCGECHTPRNAFGVMDRSRELGGNLEGPGGKIPNLRPHDGKGAATWDKKDIVEYLSSGMTPEADFAGGEMAVVIDESTSKLTPEDRAAIATFVKSLEATEN